MEKKWLKVIPGFCKQQSSIAVGGEASPTLPQLMWKNEVLIFALWLTSCVTISYQHGVLIYKEGGFSPSSNIRNPKSLCPWKRTLPCATQEPPDADSLSWPLPRPLSLLLRSPDKPRELSLSLLVNPASQPAPQPCFINYLWTLFCFLKSI